MEDRKKQVRLRIKLYKEQKDMLQKHAAAILAFCVANDIDAAEGLELSNDIFAILTNQLIEKGVYAQAKADYKKDLEMVERMLKRRAEP